MPRIVEEELKVEQVPESAVWVQFRDKAGKTHFWNRRAHETVWRAPADVDVVWVATEDKREIVYFWHRFSRVSTYDLPPLPPPK